MKYNFDEIIPRRGTGCVKWDKVENGILPMWVADMDFATPPFIIDAIRKRLECPILGYPFIPKNYFTTIAQWVKKLHGWEVCPDHMCYVPGIVKGISLAELAFLKKGDKVIVQPPIYHQFRRVSEKNGLEILFNPLRETPDGTYEMDFESLEKCLDAGAKMLLLSNPQNPSGRCWPRETLCKLAEMTSQRGVMVISDEIHCEMVLGDNMHVPYGSCCPEAAGNSITFMSPSKTFNIAGIVTSYAIIPNDTIRERFFAFMDATEMNYPSIFSIEATMAAYRNGAVWRRQMLKYVQGNIRTVTKFVSENLPGIRVIQPQASFLIWLDCRELCRKRGWSQKNLMYFLKVKARLFLNDGTIFGDEGKGFVRLNVGCPRITVTTALKRLREALYR